MTTRNRWPIRVVLLAVLVLVGTGMSLGLIIQAQSIQNILLGGIGLVLQPTVIWCYLQGHRWD